MATPERVSSILPRVEGTDRRGIPRGDEAEEVRQLSIQAHQAKDDFLRAGQAFACLSQQIAELQEELMQAAVDMHHAKARADRAVAQVKEMAGLQ